MTISGGAYSGRIERGPMAADVIGRNFTMVNNAMLRDRRLTRKARGLLVEILSHRDGFGVSEAALVAGGPEGRDAVRTALRELERFGYLHREQRREEGQFAEAVFKVTDMPEGLLLDAPAPWESPQTPRTKSRRSGPSTENPSTVPPKRKPRSGPLTDFPSTDFPSTENPLHKKNTPGGGSTPSGGEEDLSLSPQGVGERETASPDPNPAPPAPLRGEEAPQGPQGRPESPSGPVTLPPVSRAAGGVPEPRHGAPGADVVPGVVEMLAGLPGRMHPADARDLAPLVAAALAAGWSLARLRAHLARRCDPERVYDVAAVYRRHLTRLPAPPAPGPESAAAGGGPVAECPTCHGSGWAEDPDTGQPIGKCTCRRGGTPAVAGTGAGRMDR